MAISAEKAKTPFQKIYDGDWPSYCLYRDEDLGVMAFLDIKPFTLGHTVVIPREPIDHIDDLPQHRYEVLSSFTQIVSQHLKRTLEPRPLRITEHVYGFQIPHAHRLLVPSYVRGDVDTAIGNGRRLEVDPETLAAMRDQLALPEDLIEENREHLEHLGRLAVELI